MQKKWIIWGLLLVLAIGPIIQAATTATTLFVWNVPAGTRSYTITYGAACSATEFFFNEIDANFDPDSDGNGSKIPPTANLVSDSNILERDYNYSGVASPSSGPTFAYLERDKASPMTLPTEVTTEFTTDEYINVTTEDDDLFTEVRSDSTGVYSTAKFVFKVSQAPSRVKKLQFIFAGAGYDKVTSDPCNTDATGQEITTYVRAWNWTTGTLDTLHTEYTGRSSPSAQTYDGVHVNVDANAYKYIASDTNVVFAIETDSIGISAGCLILDKVDLNVVYYPDNNTFCQTSAVAPITITNNGQANLNFDGNFSSAFAGNDVNLVLKVWQGTGSGCGTNGMGGWEKDCSITNNQQDLGMTTCRQWNQSNATTNGRLISTLGPNDSNQLCFSGDINTFTRRGTYVKTFQVGDFNS